MAIQVNAKGRTWCMIFYPESLPSNWQEIVESWGHPVAISPLHDSDVNADGTPKKAHYHVILRYPNVTTFRKIASYCEELNQPQPQLCDSIKWAFEYFTHKNAPTKHQYNETDIKVINGFELRDYYTETRSEKGGQRKEVIDLICCCELYNFSQLVDLLLELGKYDLLDYVEEKTYFIEKYMFTKGKLKND